LDTVQAYQPPGGVQAAAGALASGAVLSTAVSTALPAYVLSRAQGGSSSSGGLLAFLRGHTNASQRLMWDLHDTVLAPIIGSGCSSGGGSDSAQAS
jgi:hypothetical protein